jgi:uncharacterized membrane protein YphA (DoxX/SURF4 family)
MLNKLFTFLHRFETPASACSFALFRILYGLYNIGIILQLISNWHLYFDHVPPHSVSIWPAKLTIFCWTICTAGIIIGIGTRIMAIANYMLVVLLAAFFTNTNISSFNDDLLRIGGLLLVILPVGKCFSIDTVIKRVQYKNETKHTNYLNYLLAILISLGLLYFGSSVSKMLSPMWQKGLGLWIPSVIPLYKWNYFSFGVDNKWFMITANYAVMAFELLFPLLLFFPKWHKWLATVGIVLHITIALLFPFIYVSVGPIIYYSLLIPDTFWNRFIKKIASTKTYLLHYNPQSIRHRYAVRFLKTIDIQKKFVFETSNNAALTCDKLMGKKALIYALKRYWFLYPFAAIFETKTGIAFIEYASSYWLNENDEISPQQHFKTFAFYSFVAALCSVQLLVLGYHAYSVFKHKQNGQFIKQRIAIQDFSTKPSNLVRTLFGINSRGVFLDHAFKGTKTIFQPVLLLPDSQERWLPLYDKNGICGSENINFNWHKLGFNYFLKPKLSPDTNGLKKYTQLWAVRNHIDLKQAQFRVYRKKYRCPTEYELGYLDKMLAQPWDTIGLITWKDSLFTYTNLAYDSITPK